MYAYVCVYIYIYIYTHRPAALRLASVASAVEVVGLEILGVVRYIM